MPVLPTQLEFSDDIVKIIQAAINSDGGQPEIKKANSMVKSFFVRVSGADGSRFSGSPVGSGPVSHSALPALCFATCTDVFWFSSFL